MSELSNDVMALIRDRESLASAIENTETELRFLLHELVGEHWMRYVGEDNSAYECWKCEFCAHETAHRGPGG